MRRQSLRRKSTLSSLLFGEDEAEALKSKNIKQTELVAALREAITRTAEHFHCLDPRHSSTVGSHTAAMERCGLYPVVDFESIKITRALRMASLHLPACQTNLFSPIFDIVTSNCTFLNWLSRLVSLGLDSWLLDGEPPARSRKLSCGVAQQAETGKGFAGLWAARWRWTGLQEEWHHHCES